ncbi:MAG: hypothetical protein K6T83_13025 [Alicyclobacillus sp.]|nr:hypothetical protein [Alicyclobacillus sp.]
MARDRAFQTYGTSEVELDDIYDCIGEMCNLDKLEIARVKELEVQLELHCCYPNLKIRNLFHDAVNHGLQVVFSSDMYLPRQVLEQTLRKCGYEADLNIYVSGELKKSKHEGTLFEYLHQSKGVPYHQILHIGDNLTADVQVPRALGIKVYHVRDWDTAGGRQSHGPSTSNLADHLANSLIDGIMRKSRLDGTVMDDVEEIGYRVFGPLFSGFFLWVVAQIRLIKPELVLFLARDAHLFHTVWNEYRDALNVSATSRYAYVSRASIFYPSFIDLDLQRLRKLTSGRINRTVRSRLEYIGIHPNEIFATARRLGLNVDDQVSSGDPRFYELLATHYDLIIRRAHERQEGARKYIEQLIGNASSVVIVDVGWTGSLQGAMARLMRGLRCQLYGLYFGLFSGASREGVGLSMQGWLMNDGLPHKWAEAITSGGAELLELALTAPHGTTVGYAIDKSGRVNPVLESLTKHVDEERYLSVAQRLQAGARRFMDQCLVTIGIDNSAGTSLAESAEWAKPFYELVMNPTRLEADILGDVTHSDVGSTKERVPLAKRVSSKKEYQRELNNAFWKAGFRVRNS